MPELLEVYNLKDKLIKIEKRKEYYNSIKKEFKKNKKIKTKIKTIRLLLLNSNGRIYLQKRSNLKGENLGLYDKTIGGHVSAGDTYQMTVIRECAEELGFPAAVVSSDEFEKAIKVTNLTIIGVFRQIDYDLNFYSLRISKSGEKFIQPFITSFYLGYYDGAIRFVDGESSGIEVFSIKELKKEILKSPEKFTEDIKIMIKKYEKFIKPIK